jgi:type II secretory pathway predicted ATPase ExeA
MYESFYHFSEKPFTLLPDPGFLYFSDKHRMALTLLEYGLMNQAGFTIISGDIGTGKTTLIRHLLDHMDREHTVGLISNTHRDFGELLQWVLLAFNLDHANMNKVEMYQRLVDFIIDEYAHNRRTVLIVDEAQNMDAETLEELRMLSNINADKDQALQMILVGQHELRDTLRRPDLVQFAQRISVDYHLEPLSEEETIGYVRHRLEVAGGDPDLFDIEACQAVHRFSNGVPRLINLLCDTALVYGYAEQLTRIDSALVNDVAREKQQGGIFPVYAEPGPAVPRKPTPPAEKPVVAETPEPEFEPAQPRKPATVGVAPGTPPAAEKPSTAEDPFTASEPEPGLGAAEASGPEVVRLVPDTPTAADKSAVVSTRLPKPATKRDKVRPQSAPIIKPPPSPEEESNQKKTSARRAVFRHRGLIGLLVEAFRKPQE